MDYTDIYRSHLTRSSFLMFFLSDGSFLSLPFFSPIHMTDDLSIHERIYCSNIYEREYGDTFFYFLFTFISLGKLQGKLTGFAHSFILVIPCLSQTCISPLFSFYFFFFYFRLGGGVTVLSDQRNRNLNNIGLHRVFVPKIIYPSIFQSQEGIKQYI